MNKTLAASLLAVSLFAGCGGAGASSVAGTYELDKSTIRTAMMSEVPEAQRNDPAMKQKMDEAVNGMNMTIELKADNTASFNAKMAMGDMQMPEQSATGTWKLDGSKLTIVTKDKAGKEETKVADYAPGTFSFSDDDMGKDMKMVFNKK